MKQTRLVFLLILFAVPAALASATVSSPDDESCLRAGHRFGAQSGALSGTLNQCFKTASIKAKKSVHLFASNDDASLKIVALKNLIYIQRGLKLSIISGQMSGLNDIQAVSLSANGDTIAVLNKTQDLQGKDKKSLLYFRSSQNGNVVPFGLNEDESIQGAQSISFTPAGDEVMLPVILPAKQGQASRSEIVSFRIDADSRSPLKEKKPEKKILVSSENSKIRSPIAVVVNGSQLIALDREAGLLAFDRSTSNVKFLWEVATGDQRLKHLKALSNLHYNRKGKVLYVLDSSGQYAPFKY